MRCVSGEFSSMLDAGIVPIANLYPMYAHTVWLISSIMADSHCDVEQTKLFKNSQLVK